MAKPKPRETVVWDDADVWADVDVEAAPETTKAGISAGGRRPPGAVGPAVAQPLARSSPPATATLPAPAPEPPGPGVSLAKVRVDPLLDAAPREASAPPSPRQTPPPLPVVSKPAPAPVAAAAHHHPPPLPVLPAPPTRKPPGGVSAIFLRGPDPAEEAVQAPESEKKTLPKTKQQHPKLGPAFARDLPPESEA